MKFVQQVWYWEGDQAYNKIQCDRDTRHDQYPLLSQAFFCMNCGNVWAKVYRWLHCEIHKARVSKTKGWEIIHTQCLTCQSNNTIPERLNVSGSVWNPFIDDRQLDYLPVEVLRHELNILLTLEEVGHDGIEQ